MMGSGFRDPLDQMFTPEPVFHLLDVNHDCGVTVCDIVAACQSAQPGSTMQLPGPERDLRAKIEVRSQMAPYHKIVSELKTQVRSGLKEVEEQRRKGNPKTCSKDAGAGGAGPGGGATVSGLFAKKENGAAAAAAGKAQQPGFTDPVGA